MTASVPKEITRYLRSGDHDPHFAAWPGDVFASARQGSADLKGALVSEIRKRAAGAFPRALPNTDLVALTLHKIGPMVRGLFPAREQEAVFAALERSVVFLTPATIDETILNAHWLHTAWELANLYLGSVGAELLAPVAPRLVGLSEGTSCYVSAEYFADEHRFADFIVHEAAHIFHNCKRRTIGLRETPRCERLLEIEFSKRETFAYACEAYSRILELARRSAERAALVDELAAGAMPDDERVDVAEYIDILREAACARNGWKSILAHCAPRRIRERQYSR
jgi:hypothetical protein